jgi:hypothetical protein
MMSAAPSRAFARSDAAWKGSTRMSGPRAPAWTRQTFERATDEAVQGEIGDGSALAALMDLDYA